MRTEDDLTRRHGRQRRLSRLAAANAVAVRAVDSIGALVGLDPGWIVRSATPGLERLTGRPWEEALGQPLRHLLAPGTAEATLVALAEAFQADGVRSIPSVLASGRPVALLPVMNQAPSAELFVVIADGALSPDAARVPDAGEVFRARLLDAEERLGEAALLFTIIDEISASLDLGQVLSRIVDHAARLCRARVVALEMTHPETGLMGVEALSGHLMGPLPGPPIPPEGTLAGRAMAARGPVAETGDTPAGDLSRYVAAGERRRFQASLAVPLVADTTVLGALVFCRQAARPFDFVEVRRAQQLARRAALDIRNARLHSQLKRRLDERREAQGQVVQAEKMAALGRLASGAAHEINNPLAAIVGNAELLLRRESLTPAAVERVERILQGAQRVARIVGHLLAFVRAQPPDLAPTDVLRVLREAVGTRTAQLARDGVRLIEDWSPLPSVRADGRQLRQLFDQILDNALDAMQQAPPGERALRLATEARPGHVTVRIENSGPPIPETVLPRIFDPFFTTKPVGQGTGLGLSVCHGIVAGHGGRIAAENVPRGVAFLVELPTAATAAPPADDVQVSSGSDTA
ncbi:MAG: sensor histidine kinase [Candidatus Rokuibacteriota bacterium]